MGPAAWYKLLLVTTGTIENYTDFNDIQQSYLRSTGLGQNTHFPHIDFLSLPNPDTLQDLNSFPTDTHQTIFNSTYEIVSDLKTAGESSVLIYYSFRRCLLFWATCRSTRCHIQYVETSRDISWLPSTPPTTFSFVFPSPPRDVSPPSHHIFSSRTKRSSSHTVNFSKDSHLNQYPSNNNWSDQGRECFQAPQPLSISAHISTDVNYMPIDNDDLFSCLDNSQDYSVGYVTYSSYSPNSRLSESNLYIMFSGAG
jgi:hypothetical protein